MLLAGDSSRNVKARPVKINQYFSFCLFMHPSTLNHMVNAFSYTAQALWSTLPKDLNFLSQLLCLGQYSIPTYLQHRRSVLSTHLSPTQKICAQYPPFSNIEDQHRRYVLNPTFLQHITLTDYKCTLFLLLSILCIQQGGRRQSVAWGSKRFLDQIN